MKKTIAMLFLAVIMLTGSRLKAQAYFVVETTTAGVYTYVKMPEGTLDLAGESLKGKATPIKAEVFNAIVAGKAVKALMVNGKPHIPTPKPTNITGGYMWCTYETPSGGIGYYKCKIPKGGGDCCSMVIVLTPSTPK